MDTACAAVMKMLVFFGTILLIVVGCNTGVLQPGLQVTLPLLLACWMFVWWCTPERGIFGMFKEGNDDDDREDMTQ